MFASLIRQKFGPVTLAVGLHAAIAVLLTVSFSLRGPPAAMPVNVTIKAKIVDESQIRAEMQELEQQKRAEERQRQEDAERARLEAAVEQKRLDEIRQERVVAEREERERKLQLERDKERQAKQEQERRAADARAATERKEKEEQEIARLARLKEEQRIATEKRRKEEDARAQAQREQELRESMALEEQRMVAEDAGLLAQYKAQIQQKVMRNWYRPPDAEAGINCEVLASQIPGGVVVDVQIRRCNGSDAVRQSIEKAVYRASPLPEPPDSSLFERNLVFDFIPE